MEKLVVKIIGAITIVFILVIISNVIFHWAGPEGPVYCFCKMLGHISRSIVHLF